MRDIPAPSRRFGLFASRDLGLNAQGPARTRGAAPATDRGGGQHDGDRSKRRGPRLSYGPARSLALPAAAQQARAYAHLPSRGEFVIRNAYVLTMDDKLGDLPRGDIHVRNG